MAVSTGILVHIHTMSDAIKHMIRSDYEEAPGIAQGDIFTNNDPAIGNVHNADVQTFVPIFWKGELVGWAGGVTHVIDIGAATPGSVPVGPTSRYEDGLQLTALKVGEQDTLYRDHELRCEMSVRTPMYWKLDERTRIAGCHMIREAVERIVNEEGLDTFKRFMREVIEEGRRTFDLDKRKAYYDRFQEILAEEQPYTFLYVGEALPAVSKRFRNVKPAPSGIRYNFHTEWFVPAAEQKYTR